MTNPTVFVVDDDPAVRRAVARMLATSGHQVETFAGADEFLAGFDRARPGCLILDVRMPGMDGMTLQRHLAETGVSIPVIILTAHGDVPMAVGALQAGAVEFCRKAIRQAAFAGPGRTGDHTRRRRASRAGRARRSPRKMANALAARA